MSISEIPVSTTVPANAVKDMTAINRETIQEQLTKKAAINEDLSKNLETFQGLKKNQQLTQLRSTSCPVCGAKREREHQMRRFNDDILSFMRDVSIVSLDSCILCVQKHVARAMVYYEELLTARESGMTDGTASVNVKLNHLKILGHLGCAIEESTDYTELNQFLITQERAYRYEGISPDWVKIAELIKDVEEKI
jgi:hypothetical protein